MNKQIPGRIALAALCVWSAGCAGYKLGNTLPKGLETVYVPVFLNETKEPLLETTTTQATVKEFQREGSMKIATADTSDAQLDVTLTRFELEPLRYNRDESLTGVQYRMKIYARMVFTKRLPEPTVMIERNVIGEATFLLVGDMTSSKQRALPEATRDLAHHMVEAIVEYW